MHSGYERNEENGTLMSRSSKECRDVLVRSFTLAMSDNSDYDAESTFDILTYVATYRTYIETAVKPLRKGVLGKKEGALQSADTALNRLKGKNPDELLKEAREAGTSSLVMGMYLAPEDLKRRITLVARMPAVGIPLGSLLILFSALSLLTFRVHLSNPLISGFNLFTSFSTMVLGMGFLSIRKWGKELAKEEEEIEKMTRRKQRLKALSVVVALTVVWTFSCVDSALSFSRVPKVEETWRRLSSAWRKV